MSLVHRVLNLLSHSKVDREIEAELKSHVEMGTEDNVASGMSPDAARRDALLRFRNPTVMKEQVIAVDAALMLESIGIDLRYAFHRLAKSPGFTVTAVLTFALGIGVTTAIFSAAYALLLRSLPFQNADRIIGVYETHPQIVGGAEVNFLDYQDWRRQQTSFEQMAAYSVAGSEAGSDTMSLVMGDGRFAASWGPRRYRPTKLEQPCAHLRRNRNCCCCALPGNTVDPQLSKADPRGSGLPHRSPAEH